MNNPKVEIRHGKTYESLMRGISLNGIPMPGWEKTEINIPVALSMVAWRTRETQTYFGNTLSLH